MARGSFLGTAKSSFVPARSPECSSVGRTEVASGRGHGNSRLTGTLTHLSVFRRYDFALIRTSHDSGNPRWVEFPGFSGQVICTAECDALVRAEKCESSPVDLLFHQGPSIRKQRTDAVSGARRGARRLLRVASAPTVEPRSRGRPTAPLDPSVIRGQARDLSRPTGFRGLA